MTDRPADAETRPAVERSPHLSAAASAAVSRLIDDAAVFDGVAPFNERALLQLRHPQRPAASHHLLGWDRDALVAYALLDLTPVGPVQAECVVAPEHRGRGWGRALLTTALTLASPRQLLVWAHGDIPAAARLARSLGFTRVRELVSMELLLGAVLPAVPDVPGVRVRTFRPGADDGPWLALNARAFAGHPEQGRMTQGDLDLRTSQPWFDPDGFFLAEQDGRLVGFHWTKVHPDGTGEVYVVGVDPSAQGGGLGRALTLTGLRHLRERGVPRVRLYVESDNAAAVGIYRRLGFEPVATDALYRR